MATTPRRKPAAKRKPGARRAAPAPDRRLGPLSIGAAVVGVAAAVAGALAWLKSRATPAEGHAAPDLLGEDRPGPDDRAPEAFRPDMDAPMTAAEREALRPATGPAPSLVAGSTVRG